MKFETKLMAALVAASVCVTSSAMADDKEKQNEPAGAEAQVESSEKEVQAQADVEIEEPAGAETDKPEEKFVKKAAQGGMLEVKMGQLASQKGESSSVKEYGERLVKDHTAANDKLKKIAEQKGITISEETKGKHAEALEHLATLSGEEFDKAFIKHAVEDHKKDLREYEKQSREGEDPAIRSYASEIVPVLREHLRIAQMLQENRNASLPEVREPAGAQPDATQPDATQPDAAQPDAAQPDAQQTPDQQSQPQQETPQSDDSGAQEKDAAGDQPSGTDTSNSQTP